MVKKKQARRPDVPSSHHVARYCNPQRVIRHPVTLAIEGVFPQAFELRPAIRESYLSTHWMEVIAKNIDAQFKEVVKALRNKLKIVRPDSAIARLNAGLVVNAGIVRRHPIRIRDRSSAVDPGYSGIYGMPLDNSDPEFLALLANECCIEVRGISNIDDLPEIS